MYTINCNSWSLSNHIFSYYSHTVVITITNTSDNEMCYIISNIMYYTAIRCSEIVIYMIMCDWKFQRKGRGLKGYIHT